MIAYTARQAILNRRENIVAYELFFRDGPDNFFPSNYDAHEATSKLIGRTHFNKGLKPVTSGKRALINFSEESLLKGLPLLLPKDEIIVEILETVTPNDAVYKACLELKSVGYVLALDDFVYNTKWKRFLYLTKIIKFDLTITPLSQITPLIVKLREKSSIKLLAEKVETKEEFVEAKRLGFHLFQGYYFCKPEMRSDVEVDSSQYILMQLYEQTLSNELQYKKITHLFEQDSNLTYKLLCFINSGGFPLKSPITSVKQALTYLGETQLRSLLALFVTTILASNKPAELTKMSIIRAKFCESVVKRITPSQAEEAFLCGLFSLLDAMLDSPLEKILNRLPVPSSIRDTLLDPDDKCQSTLSLALRSAKYIERNSWHLTEMECIKMNITSDEIGRMFQEAIVWSDFYNLRT